MLSSKEESFSRDMIFSSDPSCLPHAEALKKGESRVFFGRGGKMAIDVSLLSSEKKDAEDVPPRTNKSELMTAFLDMLPMLAPFFLGFFLFQGLRASFPLYLQVKFGWDELTVVSVWGIIAGSTMLVGAVSRIPSGVIADRIGRLRAIYLGFTGFIFALITLWLSTSIILYLMGFIIIRVAMNLIVMASRGAVPDVPRSVGAKNGILASMVALGGLVGPFLLTSILTWFDADSIFLAMLFIIVLDLLVFQGIIVFSRVKFDSDVQEAHRIMLGRKKAQLNLDAIRELLNPLIFPSFALACLIGFVMGLIITIQPVYGFYRVNLSFLEIGILFGVSTGLNVVTSPIIGALNGRAKEKPWIALSFALTTVITIILFFWGQSYWIFVSCSLLFILAVNIFLVSDITRLANCTRKEYYSMVFGFDSMLIMMFNALGSFATKYFYSVTPQFPYLVAAMASVIGLLVTITFVKSSPLR